MPERKRLRLTNVNVTFDRDSNGWCFDAAELVVDWGGGRRPVNFILSRLGEPNAETRGVCMGARAANAGQESIQLVLRLPDFAGLDSHESRELYVLQFKQEIAAEIRILSRLTRATTAPHCSLDSHDELASSLAVKLDGCKYELPVLLREYIPGIGLNAWCKRYSNPHPYSGCEPGLWFGFAEKLIQLVHRVHLVGAPHGYICPANIIVEDKDSELAEPRLINLESNLPDPTLRLTETERRDATRHLWLWRRPYDSPERLCHYRTEPGVPEPSDPYIPGDLYSLGLTLFYLATGKPIIPFEDEESWQNRPWKIIKNPLRKSDVVIKQEVRKYFDESPLWKSDFQSKESAIEIVFACLRLTEHRFYNARHILEVFRQSRPEAPLTFNVVQEQFDALCGVISAYKGFSGTSLPSLYRARLSRVFLPFAEQDPNRYTVGTREQIVDALVALFGTMKNGTDEEYEGCDAFTTAAFFYRQNCSSGGRVLSAMKKAVNRGAHINWLFLLDESRMNEANVISVMGAQQRQSQENLTVRWLPMAPTVYKEFLRSHGTFLSFKGKGRTSVVVIPDYASEGGRIIALRVFPESSIVQRAMNLRKLFEDRWPQGRELMRFPHKLLTEVGI